MWVANHKIMTSVIFLVLAGGGYWVYKRTSSAEVQPQYVMGSVTKGSLSVSVSGTGQVSSSNQLDLKPKASGDLLKISAKVGDKVKSGQVLFQLNARDAFKSVRDAQVNLESAQLSLNKLLEPADNLTLLQAQNSLAKAEENKEQSEENLSKAYDDAFNNISDTFLDLPSVMSGLQGVLYSTDVGSNGQSNIDFYFDQASIYSDQAWTFRQDAKTKFEAARKSYDKNFQDYKTASRFSSTTTIESLVAETYETSKVMAEAVKSTSNLIQFYVDKLTSAGKNPITKSQSHLSSLSSFTQQVSSHLLALSTQKNNIKNCKDEIVNALRTIAEFSASLEKIIAGTDELDLQSAKLSLKQKQNALLDAREKLADYSVKAPFDGTIAQVSAKFGDSVSSASSLGVLVADKQLAEVPLNEVDISKVKAGQKCVLTFDAIENLTISGTVAQVDAVGTASQGVVSYNAKIAFDTQDERIKAGMSVAANIITDIRQDVLLLPSSAVKNDTGNAYVQVMENGALTNKTVVIGLSNDSDTEIISGLSEGEQVVTQIIQSQTTTTTTTSRTGAGILPMGGNAVFRSVGGSVR